MSAGFPHRGSSFRSVQDWDDGYEYVAPDHPSPPADDYSDYAVPPKYRHKSARQDRQRPSHHHQQQQPSPPSPGSDDYPRARHSSRRDRSPVYGMPTPGRSPSPPRRHNNRDGRHPPPASYGRPRRPSLNRYDTAPPLRSSRGGGGGGDDFPPPRRRGGSIQLSPSPPPPRARARPRSRDRDAERPYTTAHRARDRDTGRERGDRPYTRGSPRPYAPSPPPATSFPSGDKRKPPISRSKTTPTGSSSSAKQQQQHKGVAGMFSNINPRWQHAATAALQSGATAAMSLRTQPGAWSGEKGARVATAALGAAALDAFSGGKKGGDRGGSHDRNGGGRGGGGGGGGGGATGGGRRKSDVQALSGALGGLLADQIARRNSKKGSRR